MGIQRDVGLVGQQYALLGKWHAGLVCAGADF